MINELFECLFIHASCQTVYQQPVRVGQVFQNTSKIIFVYQKALIPTFKPRFLNRKITFVNNTALEHKFLNSFVFKKHFKASIKELQEQIILRFGIVNLINSFKAKSYYFLNQFSSYTLKERSL